MYYTIVGYHPQTDAETKEDAINRRSALSKAKAFAAQGLIDIEVFHNSDEFEETVVYDFKAGRLVAA
jgi:hypothetical protein